MIRDYIEQAILSIEAERESSVAVVREAIRDKVAPQNAEIDTKRDKALDELQLKLNADIAALQEQYTKDRQEIINASENQKSANINVLVSAETSGMIKDYNETLAVLRKLIEA